MRGADSLSTPLGPACALPGAPSTPLRAQPGVHGPSHEGCWLARPHFLLARRLQAATGTKGGLCLILGLLPARPLPPRGPGGDVCVCSQARVLWPSSEGSVHGRPRAPAVGPGGWEPGGRQPVPDPAGPPPSPAARSPEAAAGWLCACPAPAPMQTLAAPAQGVRLSSPGPARGPLAL